ncbi:MAG: Ku protein [Myxococcota bacterium]
MALRAIGTGTISFGLVSIPIKLYSTNKTTNQLSFNLLDSESGSRLKQQYINADGQVVPRDKMVKGYEFSKGQYVTFTDAELKSAEAAASKSIDIVEFVPEEGVDWVFIDKSYYLGPDKGGDKAYRLLSEAMQKAERVAVARYAARGKQYVVMIAPHEGGLVMQQLRYADEVRRFDEVPREDATVDERELDLAMRLIEQSASESFEPEGYEDVVKARLEEMIQQKIDGKEVTASATEEPKAQIVDLMQALKASVGASDDVAAKRAPKRVSGSKKKATKKRTAKSG